MTKSHFGGSILTVGRPKIRFLMESHGFELKNMVLDPHQGYERQLRVSEARFDPPACLQPLERAVHVR